MSLRLNKAIGYALTDLVPDDPRINHESPLLNWTRFEEEDENFVAPSFEAYIARLQEAAEAGTAGFGPRVEASLLGNMLSKGDGTARLTDSVIHQPESGPNILVLIPPIYLYLHSWHRTDDSIDYVETRLLPGQGRDNQLTHLKVGLGVYSSRFMDIDGTELSSAAEEFLQMAEAGMPEEELDSIARTIRPLQWSDDRQVYSYAEEAYPRIVPAVPSDLRRLAEYGQLFTSDNVWKSLRPVLYRYWA